MSTKISIIPEPANIEEKTGFFLLNDDIRVECTTNCERIGVYLRELLNPINDDKLKVGIIKDNVPNNTIAIHTDQNIKSDSREAYILGITENQVVITGNSPHGAFNGVQSFRQLVDPLIEFRSNDTTFEYKIPAVTIQDEPRFQWRGFMLDVARHFVSKDIVKKLIDIMALVKLNVFHWHLTDDQGWRIQIKKYPKLIEVGSKRTDSQRVSYVGPFMVGNPHEGFYTQEEIKEVVDYAEQRFIKVIPEIEMPGHSKAALASYPQLSCTGGPFKVANTWGIKKDIYCAGKEKTFDFLQNVLNEIIELFPSDIIHIGGDEAPKARWKHCKDCQARIKKENIVSEHELQVYFTNRISDYLKEKGKKIMGWNEILGGKLDDDAIVQFWLGNKKLAIKHMKKGRKFVMSDFLNLYVNKDYAVIPLKKCYNFEPIPDKLEQTRHDSILGLETPMWGEFARNTKRLYWQIFPRLFAVAETGWTRKEKKNYESFEHRLPKLLKHLEFRQINYAPIENSNPRFLKRLFWPIMLLFEPRVPIDDGF